MPAGLIALAVGGFGIGLTEFVIAGLLPEIAADFAISEATAGWLISGYALSVAAGGVGLTLAAAKLPRKWVLLALMVLFVIGNLFSAVGTSYEIAMVGRVIAALCHGAFFGIGAVVAGDLVAPERRASAIAMMFAGLTTANVLGVPLGTLLGQHFGWRSTFWVITGIGIIALVAIALLVPGWVNQTAGSQQGKGSGGVRGELAAFANVQVWLSLVITTLGFGGMFGAFTYIAFTLTEVTGFAASMVPALLVVFGVGLFAGNFGGGRAANISVPRTLFVVLSALTLVLVFFALTAESKVATVISLVLMGAMGFATVAPLQTRIMSYAGAAPTLASGANIAAFNLGNAFGAWLGGTTIAAGLGYVSPIWAGAAVTFAAVAVLVVAELLVRRGRDLPEADPEFSMTQGI